MLTCTLPAASSPAQGHAAIQSLLCCARVCLLLMPCQVQQAEQQTTETPVPSDTCCGLCNVLQRRLHITLYKEK